MTTYTKPKLPLLKFKRGDHVYIKRRIDDGFWHMLYVVVDIQHEMSRVPLYSIRSFRDPRLIGSGFRQTEFILVARRETRGETL